MRVQLEMIGEVTRRRRLSKNDWTEKRKVEWNVERRW